MRVFYIAYSSICRSLRFGAFPIAKLSPGSSKHTFTFHRSSKWAVWLHDAFCLKEIRWQPSIFYTAALSAVTVAVEERSSKEFLESAAPAGNILGLVLFIVGLFFFFSCCLKCPNLLAWLDLSLLMQLPSCHHLEGTS